MTNSPGKPDIPVRQSVAANPDAEQAFGLVEPMLILMVKKYANLLLGLAVAGAVAGPMAYYHFFEQRQNAPRPPNRKRV